MKQKHLVFFRLFAGFLALVGVTFDWISHQSPPDSGNLGLTFSNFLSYFTIETNIMFAFWFFLAAEALRKNESWWGNRPAVRGGVLAFGTVTLLVYWAILAPTHHPSGLGVPANFILHLVMPILFWLDLFFSRPTQRASWGFPLLVLPFPFVYAVYSFIRGAVVGWYPYFFFNPQSVGGIVPLALYVFGLLLFFLGWGYAIRAIWNRIALRPQQDPVAES